MKLTIFRGLFLVGMMFFFLAEENPIFASETPIPRVNWGIQDGISPHGTWKPGRWMPIRVFLSENAGNAKILRCVIPDCDGVNAVYEQKIPRPAPEMVEMCVQAGGSYGGFTLELCDETGEVLQRWAQPELGTPPADARGVILVVGETAAGAEMAVERLNVPGRLRPLIKVTASAEFLPTDARALEIVDTILVLTKNDAILESWTPEKMDVLEEWMRRGGTLLLSVGKNGPKVAADRNLWGRFFPAEGEVNVVPMPQVTAVEQFTKSTVPIPFLGVTQEYRIPVIRAAWALPAPRMDVSRMLVSQYDLPLAMRSACDFGRFICVMFDLEHDALAQWGDRGTFLARLLDYPEKSADRNEPAGAGMLYGYDDLSGQFRSALDQFSGMKNQSFVGIILLFSVYLVCIGPIGFWVTQKFRGVNTAAGRVLSSAAFSWIFFLTTVFVFCFICYFLSRDGGSSAAVPVRMNRVAVTDICQHSGKIRQTLWGNLRTAGTGRFTLEFLGGRRRSGGGEVPGDDHSAILRRPEVDGYLISSADAMSCFGLPGAYLGGMSSKISLPGDDSSDSGHAYTVSDGRWTDVPLVARATKSVTAQRFGTLPESRRPHFGMLHDRENIPYGEIQNPLAVPLRNCMLAYSGWAYDLGTLAPGEKIMLDDRVRRYDLASMLVETEMVEDTNSPVKTTKSYRRITRPYDQASRDVEYILRAMMFHASTGGKTYTGLEHGYCPWLDCTPTLRSGVAVLYGTLEGAAGNEFFADMRVSEEIPGGERRQRDISPAENRHVRVIRGFIPVR